MQTVVCGFFSFPPVPLEKVKDKELPFPRTQYKLFAPEQFQGKREREKMAGEF